MSRKTNDGKENQYSGKVVSITDVKNMFRLPSHFQGKILEISENFSRLGIVEGIISEKKLQEALGIKK